MLLLAIALGGAIGSVTRFMVGVWVQPEIGATIPWGTLVVNATGSLLLGFFMRWFEISAVPEGWRAFLTVGFCGGYTTFSTFGFETARLAQNGHWTRAGTYIGTSVFLSVLGVLLGFRAAELLIRTRA
jgi:fluoride exporter